ncbi:hypothetical protein ScPMuIL_010329 [Solemya velum]
MASCSDDVILVAAIDFGTTYSGYAFSFKHEYQIDPMRIQTNNSWTSGNKHLFSHKAPTCILIAPDKTFHSFGYEAEENYSNLAFDDNHEDWFFFRTFKMKLHANMTLNRGMLVTDVYGKSMSAKTVFAMAINYLKGHMLSTLDRNHTLKDEDKENIRWVLTVPAIWNDKAKQFMREAAKEAGINNNQLLIALEPETASMYCKLLPLQKFTFSDSTREMKAFEPGTKFMVLDLGGGTVDVTIQQVRSDSTLQEIHKATGNAAGGTCVDEAFKNLLIKLVGNEVMTEFKTKYASDDLELQREFEIKKRSVTSDSGGKLSLRVPVSLVQCFQDLTKEDLKEVIEQSNYAGKLSLHQDKLQLNHSAIKGLFKHSMMDIVEHVKELLELDVCADLQIILMVGGFSECILIQDAVKKNFPNHRVIIPHQAGLAVLMGAVLFGHNPNTVASRVTKYTYGIKTFSNFREGIDPLEKKICVGDIDKCRDRFSKHVEIGETVEIDKTLDTLTYKPMSIEQEEITLAVYVTTQTNPQYTTDQGCICLGKLVVNVGKSSSDNKDRSVDVSMTFGGTELSVQARNKLTGKVTEAFFDFLEQSVISG